MSDAPAIKPGRMVIWKSWMTNRKPVLAVVLAVSEKGKMAQVMALRRMRFALGTFTAKRVAVSALTPVTRETWPGLMERERAEQGKRKK